MPITRNSYEPKKIEKLKDLLANLAEKGQPRPFEILVDNFKVVPKTEDTEQFDLYENYLYSDTKEIEFRIYHTNHSPRNDKHIFIMGDMPGSLNGIEAMEKMMTEKLAAKDKEYEARRNLELLEELRQKINEDERYITELEEKLNIAHNDRYKLGGFNMVEFGSVLLGNFLQKNHAVLDGLGLGKVFQKETKELPAGGEPQGGASFSSKGNAPQPDEQELQYIAFVRQLTGTFDTAQMAGVIAILNSLMKCPEKIETVTALLN
jgi:hypothetical protein